MSDQFVSEAYHFSEHSPAEWKIFLEEKSRRAQSAQVWLKWGAHESLRAVRDFSRSSRLRLEKFLSEANRYGVPLDINFGFPRGNDTFPSWTYALESQSWVNSKAWDANRSGYELVSLPPFFNPDFQQGFLEFLGEVLSIARLYRRPEGSIRSLNFSSGISASIVNAMNEPSFLDSIRDRYGKIESVNTLYAASFRDFTVFSSQQGFRKLLDARGWHAAFDYKNALARMVEGFVSRLRHQFPEDEIGWDDLAEEIHEPARSAFWIEGTLLDDISTQPAPLNIAGRPHAASVQATAIAEQVLQSAREAQIPVRRFRHCSVIRSDDNALLLSGKYLSQVQHQNLLSYAKSGGRLVFLGGVPKFDENLKTLEWTEKRQPWNPTACGGFRKTRVGEGEIWIRESDKDLTTQLPELLSPLLDALHRERIMQ